MKQLLDHRQPLHIGGMSDPFMPLELETGTTLSLLGYLADRHYPAVISTKSALPSERAYLDLLVRGDFVVQFSMASTDSGFLRSVDRGTPGPEALLQSASELRRAGVPVACRMQPLLPGREQDAFEVIEACASVGVRHVAAEHLKIPVERDAGIDRLSRLLGRDLRAHYAHLGQAAWAASGYSL